MPRLPGSGLLSMHSLTLSIKQESVFFLLPESGTRASLIELVFSWYLRNGANTESALFEDTKEGRRERMRQNSHHRQSARQAEKLALFSRRCAHF
jgi:hypothetical protein